MMFTSTRRYRIVRALISCGLLLVCTWTIIQAQPAFFNNGAIIGIGEGAQIGVIGNMVTQDSDISVSTAANVRIEGTLTVSSNTLSAISTAEITVTQNLIILPPATVYRYANGTIFVHGVLQNTGLLINQGTVKVGQP